MNDVGGQKMSDWPQTPKDLARNKNHILAFFWYKGQTSPSGKPISAIILCFVHPQYN